jgi:hypothetical protein
MALSLLWGLDVSRQLVLHVASSRSMDASCGRCDVRCGVRWSRVGSSPVRSQESPFGVKDSAVYEGKSILKHPDDGVGIELRSWDRSTVSLLMRISDQVVDRFNPRKNEIITENGKIMVANGLRGVIDWKVHQLTIIRDDFRDGRINMTGDGSSTGKIQGVTLPGHLARLGRIELPDPRSIWVNEAHQFTPWLLANADALADAPSLDIELTAAEHPVGPSFLDLIGRDLTNDCLLIVENQLTATDYPHLGQLITYAANLDAATIVWAAP